MIVNLRDLLTLKWVKRNQLDADVAAVNHKPYRVKRGIGHTDPEAKRIRKAQRQARRAERRNRK